MASRQIRNGFQAVVPFLSVQRAGSLVQFLSAALGAERTFQSKSGTHIEVKIGDSMLMIGDVGDRPPSTGQLFMYVEARKKNPPQPPPGLFLKTLALIRSRGHHPKGGYDGQNGIRQARATSPAAVL